MIVWALAGAVLLALVHLYAGRLRFLDAIPRSRWLSFGSGISVAYVFLHLLPELAETRERLAADAVTPLERVDNPVFVLATVGLTLFYGLERLAKNSRTEQRHAEGDDSTGPDIFWLHIGAFALYNLIIGYLLAEHGGRGLGYALFLLALTLHFLVNDYGMRDHHKEDYHRRGRWVLAGAVIAGVTLRWVLPMPMVYVYLMMAFIAGAIVLNVLKEELPENRRSRFSAFFLGLVVYAALLQML